MGILLGLIAAICWGAADFLARYATKLIGTYHTLLHMQIFGLVALSLYLLATGTFTPLANNASWPSWAWALLAALLNVVSSLALYRAFEIGVLAIVSPIAASSTALTVVLALLSGETVNQTRGIGIAAVLIGVVLAATHFDTAAETHVDSAANMTKIASLSPSERKWTRGVGWALLASCGYGVIFWLLGFHVTPTLGGIAPVWLVRLTTICTLALFAVPSGQHIRLPRGSVWWLLAGIGILDTAAYLAAAIGFTTDQISVVSVLASLFSAVTVVLAWFFLHERLQWSQWLGIVIIFVGIVLVKL